jgi:beta-lactamase class A
MQIPAERYRTLAQRHDPDLQHALETRVMSDPVRAKLIGSDRLGIGLVDLSDPERIRFAHVNGDVMMYAASLPKIAVLWAAHQAIDEGRLADDGSVRTDMTKMLRFSSNRAATAMIDRLGFDYISKSMRDPRYKLYDPRRGGGLWVGKRYAAAGRRVGDPLKNISHAASATQVCRMYYHLAMGKAFSPSRSAEMLRHLSKPGINHYFVRTLRKVAPKAALFRKSGTWSRWSSDSVLAWGPKRRYILVGLAEGVEVRKSILEQLPRIAEAAMTESQIAWVPSGSNIGE